MKRVAERWYELDDARALGEPLTDEELAFLREHANERDDEPQQSLLAEIESYGAYEPVRSDDYRRAEATLSRFNTDRTRGRGSLTWRASAVAVLAVAAAVLLWIVLPHGRLVDDASVGDARVSTGIFLLAGDELASGAAVPGGEWIRAMERACIEVERGRACVSPASELRIGDEAVELRAGSLDVEEGSVAVLRGDGVRVVEAGESVTATALEVVAVAPIEDAPIEDAPIEDAPIEDAPTEDEPTDAEPADVAPIEAERSTSSPPRSRSRADHDKTASQMLAEARALANAGALGPAVAAYDALRRAHPHSTDAHAANVSIGLLQLRRGKSRDALRAFDRYLDRAGGLAEEARWGRVKALDKMRRAAARDRAIDQLLAAHPRTVYAAEAKAMRER